jgi:hypothetical protein
VIDIQKVVSQLEQQRTAIDNALTALRAVAGNEAVSRALGSTQTAQKPTTRKRRLSAEGRKRIADAARKRWAAMKKASGTTAASQGPAASSAKPKSRITAAGRKRLAEAMRKRWAERRAGEKKAAAKKTAVKTA